MDASPCIDDIDHDFEYKDSNVSHKWLFTYPGKLMPDKNELSTSYTKETFTGPTMKNTAGKGKRKKLLEHFYRQIIAEELLRELDSDDTLVEPYETDYSQNFKHPDDMPLPGECLSKNEQMEAKGKSRPEPRSKLGSIDELKTKYPLYNSSAFTFAAQTSGKDGFGKRATITKPPEENYDNVEY